MSTVAVIVRVTCLALSFAALGLTGCGAPPRPDPDATFRAIQVHEATIAHASADADGCAADAPCPAADELCAAAEALCGEAEALGDPDGLTRCEDARRRCRQVRR